MNKIKILFIYFISIFIFCGNGHSAQIDLSSGQTWGATRGAIQSNFDEVYSAILNTYISALIGGNINGDLVTSGTIGDSRLSTNIPLLNGTQTITGTWSFPDLSYNVTSWDGILTPATKNSLRDYFYIFDSDGDGDFTDESWFPTVNTFDPTAPGEIGETTPSIGNFTTINADEFVSSATDSNRGIILEENTTKIPGVGLEEIYNLAGQLKYSENGVEKDFLEIDDTATGAGNTDVTLSATEIDSRISAASTGSWIVQEADPTSESSNGSYLATVSGDAFVKVTGGLFNITSGTYTADPTTPTLVSLTIPPDGDIATAVFSEAMTVGAGGNGGWTLNNPTNAMTYSSGSGSDTIVFSLASVILGTDEPTVSYTQPTNGFESSDDGVDLASFTNVSVTNNSTQTGGTDYSDVILHLNADGVVASTTYTLAATETGPATGTVGSLANVSSGAALVGSNGFTFPSTSDSVIFNVSESGADLTYSFKMHIAGTPVTTTGYMVGFQNATPRYCMVDLVVGATAELSLTYREDSGSYAIATTTAANLQPDTTYVVSVNVNSATPSRSIKVYSADGSNLIATATNTAAFTPPTGGFTQFKISSSAVTDGVYIDNVMVSGVATRDFVADTIGGVRMVNINDAP